MPAAVVLRLQPVAPATVARSHGAMAHAAALDLFMRLDPLLAHTLHAQADNKPFTVGTLEGAFAPVKGPGEPLVLSPDETYRWRLVGLNDAVSGLLARVSPDLGGVRVGGALFRLTGVAGAADEHPDAGAVGYEEMMVRWSRAEPPPEVTLRFLTPTTFNARLFQQPFPLPRLVFGHLVRQWNAHSPIPLDGEVEFDKVVAITRWEGASRRIDWSERHVVGFVGRFSYRGAEPGPAGAFLRQRLALLAQYAFFAGAGAQTTQGLGQVRPEGL